MVVEMPYGDVVITNSFEATHFVKYHCKDCWMNSKPCTRAQKCNLTIDQVVRQFEGGDKRVATTTEKGR